MTGEARVKGYVNLKLWLWSKEGIWVEFLEEAWVLRDLKVPLLLGKDFHVNYQISTIRDDSRSRATLLHDGQLVTIPARSTPPEQLSWGGKSEQSELQAIVASFRKTGNGDNPRPTCSKTSMPLV